MLKLTALFPPVGEADLRSVRLEIPRKGKWTSISEESIDPLSRTATFRIPNWDAAESTPYRVVYRWEGKNHTWAGTIRSEPTGATLKLGVFSCDNGYAFPLTRLVSNAKIHDPDLVFFAGDQIYEGYGGFGITREPADLAMLDYGSCSSAWQSEETPWWCTDYEAALPIGGLRLPRRDRR